MDVFLVRHGRTAWNAEGRYQGRWSDVPLSPEGAAELRPSGIDLPLVYVTPLHRTHETAARIFPGAEQRVVEDLAEMDFGAFDRRTAAEMEADPDYRAWVESGCRSRCPGGESLEEFSRRVCRAFEALLAEHREGPLALVVHGGVVAALMERFALPEEEYFRWLPANGGGYRLEYRQELWQERRRLTLQERLRFGART